MDTTRAAQLGPTIGDAHPATAPAPSPLSWGLGPSSLPLRRADEDHRLHMTEVGSIHRILAHLGEPTQPRPIAPAARGPPPSRRNSNNARH
jgi:hypothetical protein